MTTQTLLVISSVVLACNAFLVAIWMVKCNRMMKATAQMIEDCMVRLDDIEYRINIFLPTLRET